MKMLIDPKGRVGFDEWFDFRDAEEIFGLLKGAGFHIQLEEVDYQFKEVPILRKKDRYDSIPMTPKNIFTILNNADKDDREVLRLLGIDRESTFVITTLIRRLQGEMVKWEKLDHKEAWESEEKKIMSFANFFAKKKDTSNLVI